MSSTILIENRLTTRYTLPTLQWDHQNKIICIFKHSQGLSLDQSYPSYHLLLDYQYLLVPFNMTYSWHIQVGYHAKGSLNLTRFWCLRFPKRLQTMLRCHNVPLCSLFKSENEYNWALHITALSISSWRQKSSNSQDTKVPFQTEG